MANLNTSLATYSLPHQLINSFAEMSVNESAVQQIVDMGFAQEDALQALQAANGDVNQALNIMFQSQDEPISSNEMRDDASIQLLNDYPTHSFSQASADGSRSGSLDPEYAPPLPSRQNTSSIPNHIENIETYQGPVENYGVQYQDYADAGVPHEVPVYNDYSVYSDISKYERPAGSPAVLMPINNGYYESYLNPILTILHEIPTFRSAVFKHEFPTLGYHLRWFQGHAIPIPEGTADVKQGDEVHNVALLLEVQRLFAFLEPESKRAFTSIKNFISSLPPEAKREFGNIDCLRDAYEAFQKYVTLQLEQSGIENSSKFFQNQIKDDQCEAVSDFGMFSIEADEIKQNLYKTLHTLLWHDDTDNTQTITKLADVAAFTLEPSYDDSYVPCGLEVSEILYPQIYTSEFKDIVADTIKEFRRLDKKKREIAADLMSTRVFKGKQISTFLSQTLDFLNSESKLEVNQNSRFQDALDDLQTIEQSVSDKKAALLEQQNKLAEDKLKTSPHNITRLIEKSDKELEPYLLTGAILSPTTFVYLKKSEDLLVNHDSDEPYSWIYTEYNQNDFVVRKVEFDEVKRALFAMTSSQFDTPIVLVYVKESAFLADITIELPRSVKEFLEKDRTALKDTLELLSSSDEELDEGCDDYDDEDDDESVQHELIELDYSETVDDREKNSVASYGPTGS